MSAIPTYSYPCIAPAPSQNSIYLAGVPASNEGRLEIYSVNLANITSPAATFVGNQTSSLFWSSSAPKTCFSYEGNMASSSSPMFIQQFGPKTYFTNVYSNGAIDIPANFPTIGLVSNRLFSLSGAVGNLNWITGVTNTTNPDTKSAWSGFRYNATAIVSSSRDFVLSNYPTSNPLLSVGAYVASTNTPAQGFHVVFDKNGSGWIFTTLDSASPINSNQDRILSLSSPQTVDMDGITLTNSAFSLTMIGVGYILDKASDGSTLLYSINPVQSRLQRVSIPGNVPPFASNMVATAVGSQIVTYGSAANGAVVFNSFDTVAGVWSGPGLVKPTNPQPSNTSPGGSSQAPIGAIIGGVVGGLAVIALIAFLFIRHRRKSSAKPVPNAAYQDPCKTHNPVAMPLMDQNYVLQQQQDAMAQNQQLQYQQQQYNPHQAYVPQQQDIYAAQPITVSHQQTPPVIFQPQAQPQAQEPYNYVPPTFVPTSQAQQPTIFQPHTSEISPHHSYSQAIYAPPTSASTPQTPVSQAYTPTHSSYTPANPQYIAPSNGDGYAA
ncbi:hypothetical protein BC939DRAFT_165616 [Gamsiella multidivaricata]|uniref:uncharacterized protein n=1 Tax=Gamsiella multidivaricata TaxID=101098 RepID=UPI00221F431B|nr:uncharacterized protein BC939DRAFT_165616 [Gamsiella multidivaricata]KAG0366311.1 hypothetical protein BGZ54_005541 [Gamsiella multidivaricata]KAI7823175.1 hypothetical protein BC939DRAFT_165616 [Gamsiella multidivaricata]